MKRYKKLILTGVIAAVAVGGGTGAAVAATGGGDTGHAKQTEQYRTPHKHPGHPAEKGWTNAKGDEGKPSWNKDGTPPEHGGKPETHSFRAH